MKLHSSCQEKIMKSGSLTDKGRYCYFYLTIATIYVKIFSLHLEVIT